MWSAREKEGSVRASSGRDSALENENESERENIEGKRRRYEQVLEFVDEIRVLEDGGEKGKRDEDRNRTTTEVSFDLTSLSPPY